MISIQGSYEGWIVLLSFIIALFTSYSALNLTYKIVRSKGSGKLVWLIVSSLVMGCGVWTMHFVGMLAFHLDIEVQYHAPTTMLSIAASILASLLAFYVALAKQVTTFKLLSGSLFMGAGIVAMHYTGMASMESSVLKIAYDSQLWSASAVIAVLASYAALYLLTKFRDERQAWWSKSIAAMLMGIAITGMHYTGMEAASFWCASPELLSKLPRQGMNMTLLLAISGVMILIMSVTWIALFWEKMRLKRMAYTDPLTGLLNRHAMNQIFDERIKKGAECAILFVDLDQSKLINDTLGHDIGDLLVQEVGHRLNQFVNKHRHVFRLGGDEFLLMMTDLKDLSAEELASQMIKEIRRPYWLEGNEIYVTGSIGISYSPQHGTSRTELLKASDTAMYYAKSQGKNQFCAYNEELDCRLIRRMEIEKGLRTALMLNQLTTYYQPKWNAETNQPIGFEALLRWNHPLLGPVAPDEFIPIAEETGLIVPITNWVLEQACQDCKSWNERGGKKLGVSVNLSVKVIECRRVLDMVGSALDRCKLPPELLELEITESTLMNNAAETVEQLLPLQKSGVRVTMDNFGSGYTFLGSIDKIPFQSLKIDRLYMQDHDSPSKKAIVNMMITLADQLNIQLVAEGVETEQQLQFLRQAGCSIMQGYFFKRPMPREEVDVWLDELSA